MKQPKKDPWNGLRESSKIKLKIRDYSRTPLAKRMISEGVAGCELLTARMELADDWIPGVEVFPRRVYQQKNRGYFSEMTRLNEGKLHEIGFAPKQWSSALMHRDSAKGFHIHPPYVPDNTLASKWFRKLFLDTPKPYHLRPYDKEQWDVMFILTSICEVILIDERKGMPRNIMRFTIAGDSNAGSDNIAVVIPPGVGHALRNIGNQDLIMVYGTSTPFDPDFEGRIASDVEDSPMPNEWNEYLSNNP